MFALIPAEFACDTRLNRADWRVYCALATFADAESRTCWPRRKTLALRCGISSLPLISAALQRLERYGWIEIRHRRGSSFYRLLDDLGGGSPRHVPQAVHYGVDKEQTKEQTSFPPSPALELEAAEKEIERAESAPAMPSASVEPAPATAPESRSEPPTVEDQNAVAVILAYVATTAGVRPTARRHQTAIEQALSAGFSIEQCKIALAYCASHWSNAAWALPSAVLKLDRLPEVLAQAKASGGGGGTGGGQAYKYFEKEPEPERADPASVAGHLSKLKAALRAA